MIRCLFAKSALACLLFVHAFCSLAQGPSARYNYTGHLSFDIAKVPFSRYGSYLAFSALPNEAHAQVPAGVYLRSMHDMEHVVFRVELLAGNNPVPFQVKASPTLLVEFWQGKVSAIRAG